ncbi:MAG: hypothetical protein ABIF77_13650 [bacterium]
MEVSIKDRWLSAVCYLSIFVFVPIFTRDKSPFLAKHCRQGFVLLFTEIVLLLLLTGIDESIGRIPVLGLLISILLHLVFFLVFLILSVIGFMKALSAETWRLPVLDDFAEKVPIN